MREATQQFPCPGCGADMVFDIEKQCLSCPYCGNSVDLSIDGDSVIKEYPIEKATETASRDWGGKTVIIHCNSCGAEAVANANQLTAECAFCGSIHIRPQSNEDLIKPESPSLFLGRCIPGVSIKTTWYSSVVTTVFIAVLVVCGLADIIAIFSPVKRFNSVDLPTFGLPMIVTKPDLNAILLFLPTVDCRI
jgi:ribosomal protein S27E